MDQSDEGREAWWAEDAKLRIKSAALYHPCKLGRAAGCSLRVELDAQVEVLNGLRVALLLKGAVAQALLLNNGPKHPPAPSDWRLKQCFSSSGVTSLSGRCRNGHR
eukprot:2088789-Pyramimonas_sp.AAC.1